MIVFYQKDIERTQLGRDGIRQPGTIAPGNSLFFILWFHLFRCVCKGVHVIEQNFQKGKSEGSELEHVQLLSPVQYNFVFRHEYSFFTVGCSVVCCHGPAQPLVHFKMHIQDKMDFHQSLSLK